MVDIGELREYMLSFATSDDMAAAREWIAEQHDVEAVLRQHDADLVDVWRELFTVEDKNRREAFLRIDETTRHMLLTRASELFDDLADRPSLPELDELSHRFIVAVFERHIQQRAEKDDQ